MADPTDKPGFGRDEDLEADRASDRPADADMNASRRKAGRRPVINYAPDPDRDDDSAGETPPPR